MTSEEATARDAYLGRLGLEVEDPSWEALARLHRAQVERVPYETLWIQLGERWTIDAGESFDRIARSRRGGYCFHLNGAFGQLLSLLGYDVVRHVGGVHGPAGPDADEMTNHMVLTVRGLPTQTNPSGVWYVDVGLGDALHEPLPLVAGTYRQGPFRLVLEQVTDGVGEWHLGHDPAGSFVGMAWNNAPARSNAFDVRNRWLSTSPESGFVKYLTMQRRYGSGADVLRGLMFRRVSEVDPSSAVLTTRTDLVDVLQGTFGVDVDKIGAPRLDSLWTELHASHVTWEEAGCP